MRQCSRSVGEKQQSPVHKYVRNLLAAGLTLLIVAKLSWLRAHNLNGEQNMNYVDTRERNPMQANSGTADGRDGGWVVGASTYSMSY